MSGPGGRGGTSASNLLLAALCAAAFLAVGLTGAQRSRAVELERREEANVAAVGRLTTGLAVSLEQRVDEVAHVARDATAPGQESPAGYVPRDPSAVPPPSPVGAGSAPPVLDATDRATPEVAAILDRARDTGLPEVSAPLDLGEGPVIVVVAAAYVRDPGVGRPSTTPERRERLHGWVADAIDIGRVVAELIDAEAPGGALVGAVSDGGTTWRVGTGDLDRLPDQDLELRGRLLRVRAGDPSGAGLTAPTIALALLAILGAAAVGAAVVATARRLRSLQRNAADREAQIRLIGDVAPLVQQSLDLAEVLPAVAVQLTDHFDLAGVALSTGTSGAGQVELFSVGRKPADAPVLLSPPARLHAGETLSLGLQRGGRNVALLRLVAGRDLDVAELQSLRALTELVTAAVVNAALYASQQETLQRLRELDTLKTVFLGTASHELRTPATAIGGFASLLTESWDRFGDEQRRDFVNRIGANARSLSAVVADLLDFSLLDKGTLAVSIEELDLGALVGSVVDRLAPLFGDHEITFEARPAPPIAGDVNGLERIVTNLLANAVKFSPSGTTVSVSVGPAGDGYGAQLVVSDQGPGIPPAERHQVFTRFFRGSGDAVTQTRGVGIGLSVVAEFVARLRGDVSVDEAPGGGARFTVRLPASSPELLAKEAAHATTR